MCYFTGCMKYYYLMGSFEFFLFIRKFPLQMAMTLPGIGTSLIEKPLVQAYWCITTQW